MSVHVSHGLLPDESTPRCRTHGLSMELVPCNVPLFGRGMVRYKGKWAGRMIYRCKHQGCASVWNGPCEIYTTQRDSSYESILPWQ